MILSPPASAAAADAGPRKALCSIGHGSYAALLAITSPTFRGFAERHGYDLILRTSAATEVRPVPWAKVPLILELLDAYDVVLWIDADAIVVDESQDIAGEIRPGRWMYLARSTTPEGLVPNTGVWMFTRCAESQAFLRAVDGHTAFINHAWWENAAVIDLLGYQFDPVRPGVENEYTSGVTYLDGSWNSTVVDPAPRPRIKHYAGLPYSVRHESLLADSNALGFSSALSGMTLDAPPHHAGATPTPS